MAKTKNPEGGEIKKTGGTKKRFEEKLERLEELGEEIRSSNIPLEDAIKAFEEGILLARTLEKDLEKIESRIDILMNGVEATLEENPELDLFEDEE